MRPIHARPLALLALLPTLPAASPGDPGDPGPTGAVAPDAPLGALAVPGSIRRMDVEDGLAFLGLEWSGVSIVDVSDPRAPQALSSVTLGHYADPPVADPGYVYDVDAHAGHLYVANDAAGLRIYDVADPTRPLEIAHVEPAVFGGNVLGVLAEGGLLYVCAGSGGLSIWDVRDPSAFHAHDSAYAACAAEPCAADSLLGAFQTFPLADYYHDAVLSRGRLYVGTALDGMTVLDVRDPANVFPLASGLAAPGQPLELALDGDLLLGASFPYGLVGADVAAAPEPVSTGLAPLPLAVSWPSAGGAEGLAVASDPATGTRLAYLATTSGLEIVDVTAPASPALLGVLAPGAPIRDALHLDGLLYVAAGNFGLQVYDDGL